MGEFSWSGTAPGCPSGEGRSCKASAPGMRQLGSSSRSSARELADGSGHTSAAQRC